MLGRELFSAWLAQRAARAMLAKGEEATRSVEKTAGLQNRQMSYPLHAFPRSCGRVSAMSSSNVLKAADMQLVATD